MENQAVQSWRRVHCRCWNHTHLQDSVSCQSNTTTTTTQAQQFCNDRAGREAGSYARKPHGIIKLPFQQSQNPEQEAGENSLML